MIVNVLSVLLVAGLAALFVFLAARAARSRRAYIKFPGLVLSGLLALVFIAVTVVALVGYFKLNVAPHRYALKDVQVVYNPQTIARGERLAKVCIGCHSPGSLPLSGSPGNMADGAPVPMGTLYAPNLTPSGNIAQWSDAQIIRALREGVDADGRPLVVMPSISFHEMSDADAQAVVAFLRSQPPTGQPTPRRNMTLFAALFTGAGMLPVMAQPPITAEVTAPPEGVTREYGQYLVGISGCWDCHGKGLTGGKPGFIPAGPNLTRLTPAYSEAQFITLFRAGKLPSGRALTEGMPWQEYNNVFSDDELRAIYAYVHQLTPVETK